MSETRDVWDEPTPTLAELGSPPRDARRRKDWVVVRFVSIGAVWYSLLDGGSQERRRELEALAVLLLQSHADVAPGKSTLKSAVAHHSFFPSTVEELWTQAYPPSTADKARSTLEWRLVGDISTKVARLRATGAIAEAEALRRSAVTFLNKYLDEDELGMELRRTVRTTLRPPE